MMPGPDAQRIKTQLTVWWIIWLAILGTLVAVYVLLGRGPVPPVAAGEALVGLAGFVPLFISVVVRWLVLPRSRDPRAGLVMFVVGLSLAEACGILGIFLGGPYRDSLFALGVLGVLQFVPFFARRIIDPPATGFFPNN